MIKTTTTLLILTIFSMASFSQTKTFTLKEAQEYAVRNNGSYGRNNHHYGEADW